MQGKAAADGQILPLFLLQVIFLNDILTAKGVIIMEDKCVEYFSVESKQDVACFLEQTNGLHDGYIISIQYEHYGHSGGNPHRINHELSQLRIRIMVTSICDAVVEMVFQAALEWQIKDSTYDITDTFVSFTNDGNVIWADDYSTEPNGWKSGSYVIAREMKWRFL